MTDFSNTSEFLQSLSQAKFNKSIVTLWVFFLTKYHRFIKRNFPEDKLLTHICDLCGNNKARIVYKKRELPQNTILLPIILMGITPK